MSIKIGTGSSAVEPSELRLGLFSRPAVRVMVGTGSDAVPAYVRQVPPLEPKTVGSTTQTFIPGYSDYGLFATFQVTGGGKGRFKVSLNGPYIDDYAGSFQRIFTIRINGNNVASWGKNTNKSDWIVTNQLSDEIEILENATVEIWLQISTSNQSDRYLNSWSVELIPSEPVDPEDPIETVVIDATGYMGARNQFRDALTARGLDYHTVTTIPFDMDTSQATNLEGLFSFCSELTEVPDLDTSNVSNLQAMFQYCSSLTEVPEMDTSNVTNMALMFQGCTSLTEVPAMDTSKATSLQSLFQGCTSLTEVPEMDTSNVTHMGSMFSGCSSLTSVPEMDTSNVTNMNSTFGFCDKLTTVPEMDTSSVTDMQYMFAWCTALAYVPDMDTSNVTNMASMLTGTQSLTDGNVRLFGRHPDVDTTDMISSSGLTFEPFYTPAVETSLTLTVVPTEITEGESISLTATVTPADAVGSVTFAVAGETSTAVVVNGTATSTLTVDMVGEHEVSADFVPTDEADFLPSSATGSLTVLEFVPDPAVETTTELTVVPNEITEGESATLTATVTPSEAVGEVTFTVGTQTSTVALAGGTASTTFTLDTPGEYGATAEFVPTDEADFTASSDTFQITVLEYVPDPVETSTVLTVEPEEIEEGELVTVTATVTPAEAAGVIEFDVAGQLSTVNVVNGEAVATVTLDVAGEHDITADFIPTDEADFLPSSASGTVTVTEPAPAGIVPASYSRTTPLLLPYSNVTNRETTVLIATHTVVGSGMALLKFVGDFPLDAGNRYIPMYLNEVEIGTRFFINRNWGTYEGQQGPVQLNEGDVIELRGMAMIASASSRYMNWYTWDITPA